MLRWVFIVDAVVAGGFGVVLLAAPEWMMHFYGVQAGPFVARLLGAFVLGQSPMLWFARDETASPAGIAIARGHGIIDAISTAVCLSALWSGAMNAQGWVVAILFALFGSVRLYYGFVRSPAAAPA